ncbi:MAG: hypothetical protein J6Z50_07545 [Fibrobacterales bacterium]|nr:hypothetical protein [Fibrobacterales bacterium]MBP5188968.1 hypothetical protein [Fibrobacterales bacterium]MBP5351337.1 hypothetical protein [Fibrobacterales bacterium]
MASDVNDLTVNFEEDGRLKTKQLDKRVLSKGAWATIMFLHSDLNGKGEYSAPKVTIHRYKKMNGEYKRQSKFNISGEAQARQIAEILQEWYPRSEGEDLGETEE